jgi:peptidyl-prolyl cis-trans isomerase C
MTASPAAGLGKKRSKKLLIIAGVAIGLVSAAAFAASSSGMVRIPGVGAPSAPTTSIKVAALVNGKEVFESELAPSLMEGVDRAIAVDRYVNKAVAADLASKAYAGEAAEAIRLAEREVLSQLYVTKKTDELRAAITPDEIKTFYDTSVRAEDFAGYKVRFLMTADEKDAGEVANQIAAGKAKDVDGRFKPVREGGDGFVTASELPYGLGNVLRGLKKGEYSRPAVLRNGYFILFLEDVKANPKPELASMTEQIKNVLIAKKLTDTLAAARAEAHVQLR